MKKFFATFVFAMALIFAAHTPQVFAEVHIGIENAYSNFEENKIILQTTVLNTLDAPVHLKEFIVNDLKLFDADKNLIWEGAAKFEGLDVPIAAKGTVNMTFTIYDAAPPDYVGKIFIDDDSLVVWTAD